MLQAYRSGLSVEEEDEEDEEEMGRREVMFGRLTERPRELEELEGELPLDLEEELRPWNLRCDEMMRRREGGGRRGW
ncbi:hypothetical protein CRUP_008544 [Coryphaenoides rupestris]|nr:hypothetical protein CRUP_008544 [Coryphaenoides rupestris]